MHNAVHPNGRAGTKVFELARKLEIPVLVHTGAGISFANPSSLIDAAELGKVRTWGLTDDEQEGILHNSAEAIYSF